MRWAIALALLGYVMPATSILRRMADARDELQLNALRIDGTATVPATAATAVADALGVTAGRGELQLTASVSMRLPGRCRIEISSLDSTRTVAAVFSNGKARTEGTEVKALSVLVEQLCATLALRGASEGESRAQVERYLSGLKIDSKQASLGRFGGTVAYVIGAPGAAASQFWVYKDDNFHPARVKYTDGSGVVWDIRLLDYTSQSTGNWFPRLLEVWKGQELQLRVTTLNADAKPKLDDKLF